MADETTALAYSIPYSTYRLWLCLRCAKPYPDGPDKKQVKEIPPMTFCDRCHVRILGSA